MNYMLVDKGVFSCCICLHLCIFHVFAHLRICIWTRFLLICAILLWQIYDCSESRMWHNINTRQNRYRKGNLCNGMLKLRGVTTWATSKSSPKSPSFHCQGYLHRGQLSDSWARFNFSNRWSFNFLCKHFHSVQEEGFILEAAPNIVGVLGSYWGN